MVDRHLIYADYARVRAYAIETLDYDIIEDSECKAQCDSILKEISIPTRIGIEKRLYSLLHECGHALIRANWTNFAKNYAHAESGYDGRKTRSAKYKISTIEEEVEAWKRGKRIAQRLGIDLNEDRYDEYKTMCLMSYIAWAAGQY